MIVHGTSIMVKDLKVTLMTTGVLELKSLGLQTSGIDFRRLLELKCLMIHHPWKVRNVVRICLDGSREAIPQKQAKWCPELFVSVIKDRNVIIIVIIVQNFQNLSKLHIAVVILSTSYPAHQIDIIGVLWDIVQQTKTKWKHEIFFFICSIPWFQKKKNAGKIPKY